MNQLVSHTPRTNVLLEPARRHTGSASVPLPRSRAEAWPATIPVVRPQPNPSSGWMPRFATKVHSEGVFPADEIRWGIAIRHGHDEIDDTWYHRGIPGHAYLAGNDQVALCGYRPRQRRFLTRRPVKLGLPPDVLHPVCERCARHVVAPRRRVAVPILASTARVPAPTRLGPVEASRPTSELMESASGA